MRYILFLCLLISSITYADISLTGTVRQQKIYAEIPLTIQSLKNAKNKLPQPEKFPNNEYNLAVSINNVKSTDKSFSEQFNTLEGNARLKPIYYDESKGYFKLSFSLDERFIAINKEWMIDGDNKIYNGTVVLPQGVDQLFIEGTIVETKSGPDILISTDNPYFDMIFDHNKSLVVFIKNPIKIKINLHD